MFGESCDFPHQMFLIYDGIHYDALYDVTADGREVTLHSAKDERCEIPSQWCKVLPLYFQPNIQSPRDSSTCQGESQLHRYCRLHTQVSHMVKVPSCHLMLSCRCLVCGTRLRGEREAQQHAKTTSHTNFSEVWLSGERRMMQFDEFSGISTVSLPGPVEDDF